MSELPSYFQDFKKALFRCDVEGLAAVVTDDFVWEQHHGEPDELPAGHVCRGPEEVAAESRRRNEQWSDLQYHDVDERLAGNLIVQTFEISGVDSRGECFRVRAVDLYPLRDGKIAAKQTFWKQASPGPAA
ncbi:MAG: nuclear transport factor 2 family protein [Actinomycetia bacterium]|nr:nuclear transport factor 2 family protein [Actinomycetes bacterium]